MNLTGFTNFFRLEGSEFVKFQQQVEMQAHSLFTPAMGVSASQPKLGTDGPSEIPTESSWFEPWL